MIDKDLVKKMVKNINRPQTQKIIDNNIMHVEREWFFGVIFGVVLLGVGIWWSFNSYMQYSNILVTENRDVYVPVVYRENMIKEVMSDFEKREMVREKIIKEMSLQNYSAAASVVSADLNLDEEGQINVGVDAETSVELVSEDEEEILPIEITE